MIIKEFLKYKKLNFLKNIINLSICVFIQFIEPSDIMMLLDS